MYLFTSKVNGNIYVGLNAAAGHCTRLDIRLLCV